MKSDSADIFSLATWVKVAPLPCHLVALPTFTQTGCYPVEHPVNWCYYRTS